jgi:glycine dehydrogenase
MYAVYHGYDGLKAIASGINRKACSLSQYLRGIGYNQVNNDFLTRSEFTPARVYTALVKTLALERSVNFRYFKDGSIGISMDETTSDEDLNIIADIFTLACGKHSEKIEVFNHCGISEKFLRRERLMQLPLFSKYRSESEFMRYIKLLERKDYSLVHGMISLGSCTMKLNAAAEMMALTWPGFADMHPFVPAEQAKGYHVIFNELSAYLKKITGFDAVSFQPNSGAAGEYTGLLVIKKFLEASGQNYRDIVLIPSSAHSTHPASAAMAGMSIIIVNCDKEGNIDVDDLKKKAGENSDRLAAFMVTYPSTHGVFEPAIKEMTEIIHSYGGQVYMDGANMNAQVGLTNPAHIGADICHLNLHKTFAIPHGGGGPGAGPVLAASHLAPYLPKHPVVTTGGENGITAVSSSPFGSAGILVISHAFCLLMGGEGLTMATRMAILNANYLAARLNDIYQVLYKGANGMVGHEMILDCRKFKTTADVTETDIAKRLMDYGFHAPTLSFPVHGTLMVEPTESESLNELDRFVEAMASIYAEIMQVAVTGQKTDNPLKNAPHTERVIAGDVWDHPYSRWQAAFPVKYLESNKFWPSVSRIDDAYGDRNLLCTCQSE